MSDTVTITNDQATVAKPTLGPRDGEVYTWVDYYYLNGASQRVSVSGIGAYREGADGAPDVIVDGARTVTIPKGWSMREVAIGRYSVAHLRLLPLDNVVAFPTGGVR